MGGASNDVVAERERRLREAEVPVAPGRPDWPPRYPDPAPGAPNGLVEIAPDAMTAATIGGAVAHHGCAVVRGLLDDEAVATAVDAIRNARHHQEARANDGPSDERWYLPIPTRVREVNIMRAVTAKGGGVWMADSPGATDAILGLLDDAGVRATLHDYFGEAPRFSLQKSTLRHVAPSADLTSWHQDGAFMGRDVRTMNLWVALSDCGGSLPASGLEVIPSRIDEILDTSGGIVKDAVSFETVEKIAVECPVARPEFRAGDAMFFDEFFLHRTHLHEDLSEPRFALECWFFAGSHVADGYVTLAV